MTIKEVSEKFGLTQDTLRYYEKVGLIPTVTRKSGIRNYSEQDIKWVEFIKCMRSAGLPIAVLIEYVSLFKDGDKTIEARKQLLITQRDELSEKLLDIKTTIDRLNFKIESYENIMVKNEKGLSINQEEI